MAAGTATTVSTEKETERLLNQAANAKLIHLNEQLIFPMLQARVDERLAHLCEAFKTDGTVRLADVAYIAAVRDILMELDTKARHGDRAQAKLNLNPDIKGE
jgi:hypothetical protein